jgi:ergothioneine biosynthesis protein EgtB
MKTKLLEHFIACRKQTELIVAPLEIEDYSIQPITAVSPPKWHLAHSTWFFEQFILCTFDKSYTIFDTDFAFLFNSYYNSVGERVLRTDRGLMTRPTVTKVLAYREYVSDSIINFINNNSLPHEIIALIELGINHEEQHQELLIYDIKYILGHQPLFPQFKTPVKLKEEAATTNFIKVPEGIYEIGNENKNFCFDNECGRHKVYLNAFEIQNSLVTNAEYVDFIEAGGYNDFNLWHADGWDFINQHKITAPMYWHKIKDKWHLYAFNGLIPIPENEPVCHISFYEAAAFAAWKKMRLPTEFEWEIAARNLNWGALWEWTNSAYLPYPNFSKSPGAIGEYNGKFMVNQHVLRGASIATASAHSRITYRNFFHPSSRWIFSGIRLIK